MKPRVWLVALLIGAATPLTLHAAQAATPAAVSEEIPSATVSNLLHQFRDYVPYTYEELLHRYQVGIVTIEPYGSQWKVTLWDDDGPIIAILEDNF